MPDVIQLPSGSIVRLSEIAFLDRDNEIDVAGITGCDNLYLRGCELPIALEPADAKVIRDALFPNQDEPTIIHSGGKFRVPFGVVG